MSGSRLPSRPSLEQLRNQARELQRQTGGTLAAAQRSLAQQYGFPGWAELKRHVETVRGSADPRAFPHGLSATPPYYRIDWESRTIEPRQPLADADWDVLFAVMEQAGLEGLRANGQMTDAALQRLARLDQVTRLDIEGSNGVTDEGLAHLSQLAGLRELNLGGWDSPITDRGLAALHHLPGLESFQMCWTRRVTDHGLAGLATSEALERVNLLGTPVGDGAIAALRGKPRLRQLKTGTQVTDTGLAMLRDLPRFRTWQGDEPRFHLMSFEAEPVHLLVEGRFTDRGFATIAGLEGLLGLSVSGKTTGITGAAIEPLAALPRLAFLGWDGERCDDQAMAHIAALPRLRMLMAQGTVATDLGYAALSRSASLEYLWGRECPNLTGRGFAALARMPALRGLAVSLKQVDDAALSALPRFPALRELMPMEMPDDGFRYVGACADLERLWCMYCRDTGDRATELIAGLGRLRSYYAGRTLITNRSLEILGGLHGLETLEFWQTTGISDAGLPALALLPRLRDVTFSGIPAVTRQGVAVFPSSVRVQLS